MWDPIRQRHLIDISGNPGRRTFFPGLLLQAAWQMWFGEGAFTYFPRARLLAFPHAEIVEEVKPGVVFIQLYKDPMKYAAAESRRRQAAFRAWVGMDELEKNADAMQDASDPSIEIEEGRFPHGGERRLVQWCDEEGHPVPRSAAVRRVEVELDRSGEVWRKDEKVGPQPKSRPAKAKSPAKNSKPEAGSKSRKPVPRAGAKKRG